MVKKYKLESKTILWQPEKCIHSAVCVKNLREVFKPQEKPWIQPENASEDDIVATVRKCPSGALSILD